MNRTDTMTTPIEVTSKQLKVFLSCFCLFALLFEVKAQTQIKELKFDSLVHASERYQKQDVTKLKQLNALAFGYPRVNPAKGIETGELAITLAQKLNNQLLLAEAYNNKGLNHEAQDEYPVALELYEKALAINQRLKNTYGSAHNISNIGYIYQQKGDNKKAKEYYEQALTLFEGLSDKVGIAKCYNLIGLLCNIISDYPKALDYYQKALAINEQIGNKKGAAANLANIGLIYHAISDYPKSLDYSLKALAINEQIGNKTGMAFNLGNIGWVYFAISDYPKSLDYGLKALAINEQIGNKKGISSNLNHIGALYGSLSDSPKALEYFQKALVIDEQIGNKRGEASNLNGIGNEYNSLSDYSKALVYYQKALAINEQIGNKKGMAVNLGNIGNLYTYLSDYSKALEYFQRSLVIGEQLGYQYGIAGNLNKIGYVYQEAPDAVLVKEGINPTQRYEKAEEYHHKALKIAQEIGDPSQQSVIWESLSITYEKQGNFTKAHEAYKNYITLRDSIESGEVKQKIERKTLQHEFDKKETEFKFQQQLSDEKLLRSNQEATLGRQQLMLSNKEKDLQHLAFLKEKADKQQNENLLTLSQKERELQQAALHSLGKEKDLQQTALQLSQAEVQSKSLQRNTFIAGTFLFLILSFFIYRNFVGQRKSNKIIQAGNMELQAEKKKSDDLLLNILPGEIADELKHNGSSEARLYENVSVLFTDFKGFTKTAEHLSPTQLVAELHECFSAFDTIIERHGLEKIKTMGDAYMAVCGLPVLDQNHAQNAVKAAIEIKDFIEDRKKKERVFEIRIGINSGPVVAGIVGVKKFAYDIWGDTVNTANRMESSGEVGKVNISGTTYELVKNDFTCTHRGKIQAKGKGEVDMYFVDRSLSEG